VLEARTRTKGSLRLLVGCALLLAFGFSTGPILAQTAKPDTRAIQGRFAEFQAGVDEKAIALASHPSLKRLSRRARSAGIEFLVGNMLFVVAHEMGHAVISELKLPVLGREEDAADTFAIIAALTGVANDFSYRVLEETTKGWFWTARRDKQQGAKPAYHDRHALDEQRAYQIVCLMVGSDPARFKPLADEAQLPEERRRTCGWDFETAAQSWSTLLAPHRRARGEPKTAIEVSYGEAKGDLEVLAQWFRSIRFLELFAELFAERYAWPAPITLEMRSCGGEPGARWTTPRRKVHICYEMAQEFAQLYREFGREQIVKRMQKRPISALARSRAPRVAMTQTRSAPTPSAERAHSHAGHSGVGSASALRLARPAASHFPVSRTE
jgi:Putative metallopeptidase